MQEKLDHSYTDMWAFKMCCHSGQQFDSSSYTTTKPSNVLLSIDHREKMYVLAKACILLEQLYSK